MPFTLPDNFTNQLATLQKKYEDTKHLQLDEAKQPYAITRFFGATNHVERLQQIQFINALQNMLAEDISEAAHHTTDHDIKEKLICALRVLVAVTFYVKATIDNEYWIRNTKATTLVKLLDDALGLTKDNHIDERTLACVILTAQKFISDSNAKLQSPHLAKEKTRLMWEGFGQFITTECEKLKEDLQTSYPITAVITPVISKPLELAGYAAGYVLGGVGASVSTLIPTQLLLAAPLGEGLCWLVGGGPMIGPGIMLLVAPVYAGIFITTFAEVSAAWALGNSLKQVGNGIGWVTGRTLDASWSVMCSAINIITAPFRKGEKPTDPSIHGFNLIDGTHSLNALEAPQMTMSQQASPRSASPTSTTMQEVQMDVRQGQLELTRNGHTESIPFNPNSRARSIDQQEIEMRELASFGLDLTPDDSEAWIHVNPEEDAAQTGFFKSMN